MPFSTGSPVTNISTAISSSFHRLWFRRGMRVASASAKMAIMAHQKPRPAAATGLRKTGNTGLAGWLRDHQSTPAVARHRIAPATAAYQRPMVMQWSSVSILPDEILREISLDHGLCPHTTYAL